MTLRLTEDQLLIRSEAMRFLAERASPQSLRRHIEAGGGTDALVWQEMAGQLGWAAMALPEQSGGMDQGETELLLLIEAAGSALAAVPLWATTCLAAPLLLAIGGPVAQACLQRIASGAAVTVALADMRSAGLGEISATAQREGDDYRLSGNIPQVIDLAAAELVLVPARCEGKIALFCLAADQGIRKIFATMDATRSVGQLRLDGCVLAAEARVDSDGLSPAALDHAMDCAKLGLAGEQIGIAAGLAEMTLTYIRDRVQFGRTIASFQAIKHRCAALQVDLAEARALAYGVAAGFRVTPVAERRIEVAAVKALADDLALKAAREALQMHGGVAITWEYDPHFWMKRAQVNATLLGRSDEQLERIAAVLLDGGEG